MGWADNIDWGDVIKAGAGSAASIAASRQKGREAQATAQAPVDRINQDAYQIDMGAKARGLEAREAGLLARALGTLQEQAAARKAPGERATTSLRGDILANAVDAKFNGGGNGRIPSFSFEGGLRPGMFSGNTRQLGGEMSRAALLDQLKGESTPFSDLPASDFSELINGKGAPGGTPLPEGSALDSVLNAIGTYGTAAATVNEARKGPAGAGNAEAPIPTPQIANMPGMVATPAPPPVPGSFLPPQPQSPPPQVAMSSPRPFTGVRF